MRTARVRVVPYDAAWKSSFEEIKKELLAAVGDLAVGIEHIGSTSVEGLCAKPCIDMDLVIAKDADFSAVCQGLSSIGYFHEGDLGIAGREAFGYEGKAHLMKHHLYVCRQGCAELRRHLAFRDFLRKSPSAVREYGAVKMEGARFFPNDIDRYIEYKAPFIESVYAILDAADIRCEEENGDLLEEI